MLTVLVRQYGAEAVQKKSLEVLGFPASLITDFSEKLKLQRKLER